MPSGNSSPWKMALSFFDHFRLVMSMAMKRLSNSPTPSSQPQWHSHFQRLSPLLRWYQTHLGTCHLMKISIAIVIAFHQSSPVWNQVWKTTKTSTKPWMGWFLHYGVFSWFVVQNQQNSSAEDFDPRGVLRVRSQPWLAIASQKRPEEPMQLPSHRVLMAGPWEKAKLWIYISP